jgi:vesicle-associated membrane protein 7
MTNSGKALDKCQKLEGADGEPSSAETHSLKAASNRVNCRQVASRMWWRNVKLVLILDLAVCCILFAIWLGICRGFNCVKS